MFDQGNINQTADPNDANYFDLFSRRTPGSDQPRQDLYWRAPSGYFLEHLI